MSTVDFKNKFNAKNLLFALVMQIVFLAFLFFPYIDVKANEASGTISFATHKNKEIMMPYVNKFMKKYPNVKVEYYFYEDYEGEMTKLFSEGTLPDVFFVPGCITGDKYESTLMPLGTLEELQDKYDYLEKSMNLNGTIYGLPTFTFLNGIIYNKEVFAEAGISRLPKTIDEFLTDCEHIKKYTNATPVYINYNDKWALNYWAIFPFIEMTGNNLYRHSDFLTKQYPFAEGTPHYQVNKLLYDIVSKGYCEKIASSKYGDGTYQIRTGKTACMVMGSWAIKEIQGDKDVLGFMPFPNNIDGMQYVTLSTDYCYGISAKSQNPELAKLFLQYMIEESGYAYNTGNISIFKTDLKPDYLSDLTDVTIMYDAYSSDEENKLMSKLKTEIDPDSGDEIAKIIECAGLVRNQSFDDLMTQWNVRWEKGRPADQTTSEDSKISSSGTVISVTNEILELSVAELDYIKEKKSINMGYLKDYAPFSYERNNKYTGLSFGVCEKIREMTGLEFNYIGFDTPESILDAINNQQIDVMAGTYKVDQAKLKYSKSFFDVLNVYVINKNKSINDIDELKIASTINWEKNKNREVLYVPSTRECFKAVEEGEADFIETNYYLAQFYIDELGTHDLEIKPGPTYSTLHFAIKNTDDPTILAIINKSLYTITNQDIQVMMLEYNTPLEPPLTVERIIRTNPILFVSIVLLIVGLIMFFITVILVHRIISSRRRNFEVKKYRMLSSLSDEYMFDLDYKKHVLKFDKKFMETFGFPEIVHINDKNHSKKMEDFIKRLHLDKAKNEEDTNEPFEIEKLNGEKIWFKMVSSTIYNKFGQPLYLVGKMANVQEEMENVITYQEKAGKDELTQIHNRRGFYEAVPKLASDVLFAVIDIDDFKGVNDTLGHEGGDAVLCFVTKKMKEVFGTEAYFGRYGGDEFMIVSNGLSKEEADEKLAKLVECVDMVYAYNTKTRKISLSIGAVYSEAETEVNTMFTKADEVLYKKKKSGKNGYVLI